jgi:choice-of-anchor B domain-containing protein
MAQQPPSYNTSLFGQLNPDPSSGGRYSALTGYAASDGREYAILGGYNGTHIVDVTEQPIKQVAFIAGPQSGWREMKTYGHYAYVVSEGGSGLQIIDLSNLPDTATLVASDVSIFQTAHTITQHDHYLYVNGTNTLAGANQGTIILDLQPDPVHPRKVGMWTGTYVHDCTVRNDTLYSAAINDGWLDIIYLGPTQANPTFVTRIEYPSGGTHNSDLTTDGSYILTTDEINATPKTLKVWDRRDINSITKVADYTPVPGEIVHNVHVKGRLAFVAWYSAGTRVIDISNPADPVEVGYYDTYPGAVNDYVGNWGVYPYLPSGKIISSDMQSGLFCFTFNGAARGSVHGVVRDATTNAPIAGAVITIDQFGRTVVSDTQGKYSYGGAVDSLSFTAAAFNYNKQHGTLVLTASGSESDILMSPLVLGTVSVSAVDALSGASIPDFSYRIFERSSIDGHATANPQTMMLPVDSTYHLYVGAWGYKSKMVEVKSPAANIAVALDRGYFDDAELDLGWSLAAAGDTAHSGRWERGVPVETGFSDGTVIQPGSDHSADPGDHAFITGIAGSDGSVGSNDVDDGATTLTSSAMDLTAYKNPAIDCFIWYSRNGRFDAVNDTLLVLISNDDGQSWKRMDALVASPQQWLPKHYRIADFVTPSVATRFRIVASDYDPQSVVEAGLDDFSVSGAPTTLSAPASPAAPGFGVGAYSLHPNPFNGSASLDITFAASQRHAVLELYDAYGQRVRSLFDGAIVAGSHTFAIDGAGLSSGRYLWRLTLDDGSLVTGGATLVR